MTILIIVESPGKIDKIGQILGSEYKVMASYGHIMDLDPKSLSIDIVNNFTPSYVISSEKKKTVQNLRSIAAKCDQVIIASDMDREGEMIGYSIKDVLKLTDPKRIVFNQITKTAILDAVSKPTVIDMNMVYAQQTRRLLDRLVGYKISPLLWKQLQGKLSAGRVQSVVLRIIIDLENEIKEFIPEQYFKTTAIFQYDENTLDSVLMKSNEVYRLDKDSAIELLKNTNKSTPYVKSISDKEKSNSPPPPHITSTLMQEASTKFNMNSKRTMDCAQKLYEGGYITYMRTDSTTLSKDAIGEIKKFVSSKFGEKYYMYRVTKNDGNAQEAHEAIRPTKIDCIDIDEQLGPDCQKLYTIIWKRTVASLMANAKISVQTIEIDFKNKSDSIFLEKDIRFVSTAETILFDGHLVLNNRTDDTLEKKHNITIKTKLVLNNIESTETFTSPPLRYNEAGLIKYLKTNGIGRPSTYASIISKIVEREYVVIKSIDGVKKNIVILSSVNKKLVEKTKSISVGKENMKIQPTDMGNDVNSFMMTNFAPIMDIKYTAKMEEMLDMIAEGKAKWYNVLGEFYSQFSPMVEILEKQNITSKLISTDKVIGHMNELPIYLTKGKYGMCVKIMDGDKWKYASIESDTVTQEQAIELFSYPKDFGVIGGLNVVLHKGKYGLYFKVGDKSLPIKDSIEPTLEYAIELMQNSIVKDKNTFIIKNKTVYVKSGEHGPYLMIPHGKKKPTFISIPSTIDSNKITAVQVAKLMKC